MIRQVASALALLFLVGTGFAQVAAPVVPPPPISTPPVPAITCRELFTGLAPEPVVAAMPAPFVRSDFAIVQIAGAPGGSKYVVNIGDHVMQTNDVRAILKALPTAEHQYVDVTRLTPKQREAFAHSAQAVLDSQAWRRVRVVENAAPLVNGDALRSSLVFRDTIRETSSGSGKYAQRADALVDGTPYSFRAISRLKTAVTRFFDRLKTYFTGSRARGESTFDVVHRIRHEVALEYGMSDNELQIEIRDGLGSSYWVQLRLPSTTDVW